MRELLIGCGNRRQRAFIPTVWDELVTLDRDPACKPDVVHDLEDLSYPFDSEEFDGIHAYCVLEHLGRQGDWKFFFGQWTQFYRMLKPGGKFYGIVPSADSEWAWGDPSHTRIITVHQLGFLSQDFYRQVGETSASDFRGVWKGNFRIEHSQVLSDKNLSFILRKS
jgi:predicted SAM-dependent methyltransferase